MSLRSVIHDVHVVGLAVWVLLAACSGDEEDSPKLEVTEAALTEVSSFEPHMSGFEGFLGYPYALDTDEEGNIYVLDQKERRVVVLDTEFRVLSVIGRQGAGPGEFEFRDMGAHAHRISVRMGILAVDDSRQTVHVFRTDGTYLTRFRIQGDSINDIEVTPEGSILVAVFSQENSLWEFTQDGREIRRYGIPLVQAGLDPREHPSIRRYAMANDCEVEILSDGRVVTLSSQWPRLRVYDDGVFQFESDVELMRLAEIISDEEAQVLEEAVVEFEEHPPERVNEAARNGTLTEEHPGLPYLSMLMQIEPRGDRLWGHMGGFLFEVGLDGSIPRVVILASDTVYPSGAHGMEISGNRIILSYAYGASLAYADLPW